MSSQRQFPNLARSVSEARHFVAQALSKLPTETVELATLMVSELATNCIRHALTGFSVHVEIANSRVRVEVCDHGRGHPNLQSPRPTDLSGRVLRIIEVLSSDWGISDAANVPGKGVWFTIPIAWSPLS